ncbi:DUF429 domain-containing protein [Promicromonospora sp. NPDC052451]|uniref:DUF429 domain-containing protein n=1 Tax=Promicromonospora sp. NPDC052451 TaxID=3364407 RepID=UPI0037C94B15
MTRVLGVDGAGRYWVAVASDMRAYADLTLTGLLAAASAEGPVEVIGVDIPIGLPASNEPRLADRLAREAVGPRWRSVFVTPPRRVLDAETYEAAGQVARRMTGKGISRQAWALKQRILEADLTVRSDTWRVVEVHPEVSFVTMAGRYLPAPKSTWAGLEDRRRLLETAGISLPADLGPPGFVAGADDVLDAAVACWTAGRVLTGSAQRYPDPPQVLDGMVACIHA